jgi:hypothetical protein
MTVKPEVGRHERSGAAEGQPRVAHLADDRLPFDAVPEGFPDPVA